MSRDSYDRPSGDSTSASMQQVHPSAYTDPPASPYDSPAAGRFAVARRAAGSMGIKRITLVGGALIVAALAYFGLPKFGFGPGGGGGHPGGGSDPSPDAALPPIARLSPGVSTTTFPSTAPTTAPAGPMRIMVDGSSYIVDGRPLSLDEVLARAKSLVFEGEGAAVEVVYKPESKAKAEVLLKQGLQDLKVHFSETAPPASE